MGRNDDSTMVGLLRDLVGDVGDIKKDVGELTGTQAEQGKSICQIRKDTKSLFKLYNESRIPPPSTPWTDRVKQWTPPAIAVGMVIYTVLNLAGIIGSPG